MKGLHFSSPTCQNRLWRSELEVSTESSGPITRSISTRRPKRSPCRCEFSQYPGLNSLFSNRAEEFVRSDYNILQDLERLDLPRRKPDRMYGLRQTRNLSQALGRPANSIHEEAKLQAIRLFGQELQDDNQDLLVEDFCKRPLSRMSGTLSCFHS